MNSIKHKVVFITGVTRGLGRALATRFAQEGALVTGVGQTAPLLSELSEAIFSQLSDRGFKILRGENRTVMEFWPCKKWEVQAGFAGTDDVLHGQLEGVTDTHLAIKTRYGGTLNVLRTMASKIEKKRRPRNGSRFYSGSPAMP